MLFQCQFWKRKEHEQIGANLRRRSNRHGLIVTCLFSFFPSLLLTHLEMTKNNCKHATWMGHLPRLFCFFVTVPVSSYSSPPFTLLTAPFVYRESDGECQSAFAMVHFFATKVAEYQQKVEYLPKWTLSSAECIGKIFIWPLKNPNISTPPLGWLSSFHVRVDVTHALVFFPPPPQSEK